MVQAQQWLESQEQYNTKQKRQNIKELEISNKDLEGELNLSDFDNLEHLVCLENNLTKVTFSPSVNEKLTYLDISNNNFPEQDLSFLTNLVNLKFISLGNNQTPEERIEKDIYNRFHGSLEPLKNMPNLRTLWIDNTDLNEGLEHLPKDLERLYCDANLKESFQVGTIGKELLAHRTEDYGNNYRNRTYYYCDFQAWKEVKMEELANKWLTDIVTITSEEVNNYDSYDSNVKRTKGNNSYLRGHYFIFYEDGSTEHWLTLCPVSINQDNALVDGHTHGTFILNFDKPVKKFIDVYTCIGCGASEQGYTALHSGYDDKSGSADNWDTIHKGLPFEPWHSHFTNVRVEGDKIIGAGGGSLGIPTHVWQGASVQDSAGKTFDKAYGYIPSGWTLQWRLERSLQNIEENQKWTMKKVSNLITTLRERKEFSDYKDESPHRQNLMHSFIEKCLKEKEYVLTFKYSDGENTLKINDILTKLADNFKELITLKQQVQIEIPVKKTE